MNKVNRNRYSELMESIIKAQEVFNSKWKLPIIITLLAGNSKFNEIGRSLPKISSKILIKELRELEAFAIVRRTVAEKKYDVTYTLENCNRELRQIVTAYKNFSIALMNHSIPERNTPHFN